MSVDAVLGHRALSKGVYTLRSAVSAPLLSPCCPLSWKLSTAAQLSRPLLTAIRCPCYLLSCPSCSRSFYLSAVACRSSANHASCQIANLANDLSEITVFNSRPGVYESQPVLLWQNHKHPSVETVRAVCAGLVADNQPDCN